MEIVQPDLQAAVSVHYSSDFLCHSYFGLDLLGRALILNLTPTLKLNFFLLVGLLLFLFKHLSSSCGFVVVTYGVLIIIRGQALLWIIHADLVGLVPKELHENQCDQLKDSDEDANDLSRRSVINHRVSKVSTNFV